MLICTLNYIICIVFALHIYRTWQRLDQRHKAHLKPVWIVFEKFFSLIMSDNALGISNFCISISSWLKREVFTNFCQSFFNGANTATSRGCKICVAFGGRQHNIICCFLQKALNQYDICDMCPSRKTITGFFMFSSCRYLLKTFTRRRLYMSSIHFHFYRCPNQVKLWLNKLEASVRT